ncbi:hypothetical protein [Sphingomonas sanguinis]|jgi:hypothetical protein|uniref:DUF4148 domain-containing protein n=1 Tax=Sphingomonas sanguinis TaxID=33051 RepID=A0A7Y7QSK7_9SPHN|nr:hypothetical protein [Sphingomonas sanguinis]MBZ6380358.1 hypothetical protein [Sphingomonas sanguinis]NNG48988.1 hypothetical protein [Sphingomonas sanguinis]NNG52237.1 hypothetical protein [Sphingomonas sanguinis]NVP29661.1 hypothetical protein [Sphingomonas sanguinis]
MKRCAISAVIMAASPAAAPAQFVRAGPPTDILAMPNHQPDTGMDRRDIRRSIREGQRSGDISRAEARSFRREDAAIGELGERFAQDGLSLSEERELQVRTEALRGMVNARRVRGGQP